MFIFYQLKERNGEYEYLHSGVRSISTKLDPMKWADKNICKQFYNTPPDAEDGGYYFNCGEVFVCINDAREITQAEYLTLQKYLG